VVPRASHGVADDQPLGERTSVVRAGCADREKFVAPTREQHRLIPHMPGYQAAIAEMVERNAAREVWSLRLRLLSGHDELPIAGSGVRLAGIACAVFAIGNVRTHPPSGQAHSDTSRE
jgi:hypothetical protein